MAPGSDGDAPPAAPAEVALVVDATLAPKTRAWEDSLGGREAAKPRIHARLAGWPKTLVADRASLPADDREFLWRLARDTWRGLDALTDRENGLPIDHVRFGRLSAAPPRSATMEPTHRPLPGLGVLPWSSSSSRARRRWSLGRCRSSASGVTRMLTILRPTSLERTSGFISSSTRGGSPRSMVGRASRRSRAARA
jgi:hypothetical protein